MTLNKKGVSEMVGYVILIVIAVGLSVLVFNYLKVYIPKEKAECTADINLIIKSASCTANKLTLNLVNKGLFRVDAAYIRFAPVERKVKDWINDPKIVPPENFNIALMPGKNLSKEFSVVVTAGSKYGVEVQPAVYTPENVLALCEKAVITQEITCN